MRVDLRRCSYEWLNWSHRWSHAKYFPDDENDRSWLETTLLSDRDSLVESSRVYFVQKPSDRSRLPALVLGKLFVGPHSSQWPVDYFSLRWPNHSCTQEELHRHVAQDWRRSFRLETNSINVVRLMWWNDETVLLFFFFFHRKMQRLCISIIEQNEILFLSSISSNEESALVLFNTYSLHWLAVFSAEHHDNRAVALPDDLNRWTMMRSLNEKWSGIYLFLFLFELKQKNERDEKVFTHRFFPIRSHRDCECKSTSRWNEWNGNGVVLSLFFDQSVVLTHWIMSNLLDRCPSTLFLKQRHCSNNSSLPFSSVIWSRTRTMSTNIPFAFDAPLQSSHAHQLRPTLPAFFADCDVQRTIAMNKIASTVAKKKLRLQTNKEFLPLTPTIVPTPSPLDIDIQAKLGEEKTNERFIRARRTFFY